MAAKKRPQSEGVGRRAQASAGSAPKAPARPAAALEAGEPAPAAAPEKGKRGQKRGRPGAPPAQKPRKQAAQAPAPVAPSEPVAEGGEVEPEVVAVEVVGEPAAAEPGSLRAPALPLGDEELAVVDEPLPSSRLPVPVGRDLSHADALQRYLAEISRHPLLTREEEHDLAVRFQQTRDPRIAYRMVTANLRLVVKIAMEYRRAAFNVLDLIQEGNVGLMQAVQKYDPFRGVKLSSYAAWWIRAYILRFLMDNWRMVKLGTTQAQRKLFFNLRKEQERLLAQGYEAAPKLLAERLEVSEQDVREMDQRLGNDEFSIDMPVAGAEDSRQTYVDRLAEAGRGAEEQLGDEELLRAFREHLAAFGRTLTDERDLFLFHHRIAVPEGQEPLTLQEVGEKYGFTRERARQLEARLTSQLRDYLRERLPDFAQLSLQEERE